MLTFLTLGVSFCSTCRASGTSSWGWPSRRARASLVVLFFMHAIVSPQLTWIVIAVACFWVGILFVLTLGDYFSRGSVPFMPGH